MAKVKYPRAERRKLSELSPNAKNPRRITAAKKAKLKKSLDDLGNIQPVTFNVRTGKLVGGHKRVEILIEAGEIETDVWCVDLPAEKESAAMLALNTLSGEWDEEKLSAVLEGLEGSDFDADFFDLADALDAEETKIEKIEVQQPPKFAWVLIGAPITQFAKVQALLDKMPAEAIMKTTANDGPEETPK
jgi:ParB-like chromosome segregation protein Spo0J